MGEAEGSGRLDYLRYFIDRGLGRDHVRAKLIEGGVSPQRIILAKPCKGPEDNDDWIKRVGRNGWIGLTKDKRIGRRAPGLERRWTYRYDARLFQLERGQASGERQGNAFLLALPGIKRLVLNHEPPFIARVSLTGRVSMWKRGRDLIRGIEF